jgi:hypothetical protein
MEPIATFNGADRKSIQDVYFMQVVKQPDYAGNLMLLPLLKVNALPETLVEKQPDKSYLPSVMQQIRQYAGGSFLDPASLKSTIPFASGLESKVSDSLFPDVIAKQLSLDVFRLPPVYMQANERAASGESILGINPNPSAISYLAPLKPYVPVQKFS